MLARVQQGDLTVDFRAFRVAGSSKTGAKANNAQETGERIALKNAAASGGWSAALDPATYRSLDKAGEAAFHEKILDALLDSIRQSGDGKGAETAYFVHTPQNVRTATLMIA